MKRLYFYLCLLSLLATAGHAQVINTEGKRNLDAKDGWGGSVDLGFGLVKNTKRILQASSRVNATYHKDKHTLLLINDLNLLKVDSNSVQNSGFQHVRYSYQFRKYLIPEAFMQAQYNQVWKLDFRYLAGIGPRFQLLKNDSNRVFLGTMLMYEFEKVNNGAQYNRDLRSSSYLSVGLGLNKHVTFEHITYYQPLFRRLRDFRVSSETSLRTSLAKHWSFKTSFAFNFDARPPDAQTRLFYAFMNGLTFKF